MTVPKQHGSGMKHLVHLGTQLHVWHRIQIPAARGRSRVEPSRFIKRRACMLASNRYSAGPKAALYAISTRLTAILLLADHCRRETRLAGTHRSARMSKKGISLWCDQSQTAAGGVRFLQ